MEPLKHCSTVVKRASTRINAMARYSKSSNLLNYRAIAAATSRNQPQKFPLHMQTLAKLTEISNSIHCTKGVIDALVELAQQYFYPELIETTKASEVHLLQNPTELTAFFKHRMFQFRTELKTNHFSILT